MEPINVYVLTRLALDAHGGVQSQNVGVTFSLHEAERHREQGVEHNFETFKIPANWQEQAAATDLVVIMREFRSMVEQWQAEALIEG